MVNDYGGSGDGTGADQSPAHEVAERIREEGGHAVADGSDVADFASARRLIESTLEHFGRLDALVNNAGIVRQSPVDRMAEREFDTVVAVHLKGHFNCARWAGEHWRRETERGILEPRHVVNTTCGVGLVGGAGQTPYGAAKAGIAMMTRIWALDLDPYGVRVNAIAPVARTRLSAELPDAGGPGVDEPANGFDALDPANVAPLAVYLASDRSNHVTGEVFAIRGGAIGHFLGWRNTRAIRKDGRWEIDEIDDRWSELMGEESCLISR